MSYKNIEISPSVTSSLEHPLPKYIPLDTQYPSSSGTPSSTSPSIPLIQLPEKKEIELVTKVEKDQRFNRLDLKEIFEKGECNKEEKYYSKACNQFLLKKELLENQILEKHEEEKDYKYLYPNLNDPQFIVKIAEKKEFNDSKYDGEIHKDVKKHADLMSKFDFELAPHQSFVRNFLSFQTPYNSLLLYHGLGSGKTCSAIGVCEEMRDYLKQIGSTKRIIIVASENVQDNFRLQLFDARKLKNVDGIWNIKGCIGNKLLKEVNPNSMNGLSREKIIQMINSIINTSYLFLGYGQFANYIIKTANVELGVSESEKVKRQLRKLRNEFNGRMIVIDEVHNIRMTEDNENKKVAMNLELLVKSAENMHLLLLSATPMYNSYKEIIWLLNLMNINDRRGKMDETSIFDKNGNFKPGGEELLIRKATGYVSFVRGENPYTFPYRIYPEDFSPEKTFLHYPYPSFQMNGKMIAQDEQMKILKLYLQKIGEFQSIGYRYIIQRLLSKENIITTKKGSIRIMPSFENMESFGYTMLQKPLEALIIVYPHDELKKTIKTINIQSFDKQSAAQVQKSTIDVTEKSSSEDSITSLSGGQGDYEETHSPHSILLDPRELTGTEGLQRMMNYVDTKTPPEKGLFEYKTKKYGRIFSRDEIGKYSCKIRNILDSVLSSEGIILIYSQYIDSGLIPVALALEELGFTRYGENVKNLFKDKPSDPVDVRTMKPRISKSETFMPARYSMITGDKRLSPNNDFEVKGITSEDNIHGYKSKVILISKAGSEGIDLKFIRQVHILEPWYNMNRVEQTIGRAVRNFSHKDLPFEKRNVEIFMYGTILEDPREESADLYVYRVAEYKALQIGKVSRILKETAVDCLIHHEQTNFSREILSREINKSITQILSSGKILENFQIGDAPYSAACDYMETCHYSCRPNAVIDENHLNEDTYNEKFIMMNSEKIIQKIKMLMKESFFYKKNNLLNLIDVPKKYPLVQKYAALTQLIEDSNEFIIDKYDRTGHLINIGDYYLFQPNEINYENISIFDRSVPIDYKHSTIEFSMKDRFIEKKRKEDIFLNEEQTEEKNKNINKLIEELNLNYKIAKEYEMNDNSIKRGENDWYKYVGVVMKNLVIGGMNKEILDELLIDHILDVLLFKDKLELMNYLYSLNFALSEDQFEFKAINYFRRNSITFKNVYDSKTTTTILLYDIHKSKGKEQIFIFKNDLNQWVEAEPEDKKEILESPKVRESWVVKTSLMNKFVGFIGYERQNRYLVFKIRDNESNRNSGARCDESGKLKTIQRLNEIVGEERYNSTNTKTMIQQELCCLEELLLRYFNKIRKDGKIWFLNSDIALFNKF